MATETRFHIYRDAPSCLPTQIRDGQFAAYDDVAAELGIAVIRLRDTVCPSYPDDCDRIHRYDGLHYNGEAASHIAKLILDGVT